MTWRCETSALCGACNAAAYAICQTCFSHFSPRSLQFYQLQMSHAYAAFRRKKDHGRAEALLIAAWSANMRQRPPTVTSVSSDGVEDAIQLPAQEARVTSAAEQCLNVIVEMCAETVKKPAAGSEQQSPSVTDPGPSSVQSRKDADVDTDTAATPLDPTEFAAWKEAVKQRMVESVAPSQRERVAAVLNAYPG